MAKQKNTTPDFEIVKLPIERLIPYAMNSRVHSDKQIDQIAASIAQFGFTQPIIVRKKVIVAGHGRVLGAKKVGLTELPCIIADHWTDAQMKAYVITDNKLPQNATWDFEMLKSEIEALDELGFDRGLTGFDDAEFKTIMGDFDAEPPKDLSKNIETVYKIEIECRDEMEQEDYFNRFQAEGLKCRLLKL